MLLRARTVLPVTAPPLENGAVRIRNGLIAEIGSWGDLGPEQQEDVVDLGDSVLLPGLINSHCHLDYTGMRGQVVSNRGFSDWIKLIMTLKTSWTTSEFEASWKEGAEMLVRNGTTLVADIEAVPELLPGVWGGTPLRVISFLEMTGVRSGRNPEEIAGQVLALIDSLPPDPKSTPGLSPHSPYATMPRLLELAGKAACDRGFRITTHLAESEEEYDMFMYSRGPLYEWLKKNNRDMSDCGIGSPVRHLERHRLLGAALLAVHVNYLWDGDADLLAKRGVSVVHCPNSHEFFRHRRFPLQELKQAGVNLCLGTDSLASTHRHKDLPFELNLFWEMQTLLKTAPALDPKFVLQMATRNGAAALGYDGELGEIRTGARADLISLPFSGKLDSVYESIVFHEGPVRDSMIAGKWIFGPRVLNG